MQEVLLPDWLNQTALGVTTIIFFGLYLRERRCVTKIQELRVQESSERQERTLNAYLSVGKALEEVKLLIAALNNRR